MTKPFRILMVVAISSVLLSACGAAADAASPSGAKVEAVEVAFTGVIEAMNGTRWVVNGQLVTVDPSALQNTSFQIGETVKVQARVAADGSVSAMRVETQTAALAAATLEAAPGAPATTLSSGTPIPPPAPVASGQGDLVMDDSDREAFGTVDAITADSVTVGGQVFTVANGAEFRGQVAAGVFVKVHFMLNADGTMSITEIETWDPNLVGNDNSNFNDNSNDDDSNSNDDDDHGNGNGDD